MSPLSGIGGRLYRGETSIDFVGKRRRWYSFSGLLIVLSAVVLGTQGLNLGIEFKGGSEFSISKPGVTVEQGRAAMKTAGVSGESVVQIVGNDRLRIQTGALESFNEVKESLASTFGVNVDDIDTQIIGPSWGEEITKKALYGLIGFIIIVLLFLAMTFEPKMAIAAIVATVHDVFITVGIYALVGFDVTPATIIGFSLFVGLTVGTYSSVFIATPLLAQLREREPAMRALAKRVAQHAPGAVTAEGKAASSATITDLSSGTKTTWARGPRNQPKRKRR